MPMVGGSRAGIGGARIGDGSQLDGPIPLSDLEDITAPAYLGRTSGTGPPQALTPPWLVSPVALSDLANIAQNTVIGRASGAGTGAPTALAPPTLQLPFYQWLSIGIPGNTTPFYIVLVGTVGTLAAAAAVSNCRVIAPVGGTLVGIRAVINTALTTDDITFQAEVNGSTAGGLSATLLHNTTSISATGSVAVAAGDYVTVKCTQSGTQTGASNSLRVALIWQLSTSM